MSISIQWARSVLMPIPGTSTSGTVILVSGANPQANWSTQILFRALEGQQPTLFDFWCYAKLGRVLNYPPNPRIVKSYGGLSMYDSLGHVRSVAKKYNLGTFIAEIHVPMNGWFDIIPDPRQNGHVDVMGDGEHLSRFIQGIHPV